MGKTSLGRRIAVFCQYVIFTIGVLAILALVVYLLWPRDLAEKVNDRIGQTAPVVKVRSPVDSILEALRVESANQGRARKLRLPSGVFELVAHGSKFIVNGLADSMILIYGGRCADGEYFIIWYPRWGDQRRWRDLQIAKGPPDRLSSWRIRTVSARESIDSPVILKSEIARINHYLFFGYSPCERGELVNRFQKRTIGIEGDKGTFIFPATSEMDKKKRLPMFNGIPLEVLDVE